MKLLNLQYDKEFINQLAEEKTHVLMNYERHNSSCFFKGKKALNLDINFVNYGAFLEYVSDVDELRRTIIKLHNESN